jgi:hypothetical protein
MSFSLAAEGFRVDVSDYPTCERTYATLRIYPESLDPSDVTVRLGIEPSDWQRRGEARKPGSRPAKLHGWFLSSERAVESRDVRKHLDWLLSLIVPRAYAILALQSDGCRMDVSCFWVSASGHGGPSVRPAQMSELARLDLELWFDVYLGAAKTSTEVPFLTRPAP